MHTTDTAAAAVTGTAAPGTAAGTALDAAGVPLGELTTAALERWLTERLAFHLERRALDVDPATPLADYGLDSLAAFGLCGEIEQRYLLPVDPTVLWEYPTVRAVAGHLAERLTGTPS